MAAYPLPLYGNGMHDYILRELEVGRRVAAAEDDEHCGFGPLLDLQFQQYCQRHPDDTGDISLDSWEWLGHDR